MNLLYKAYNFARVAHDLQKRKYINEEYFQHPLRVLLSLVNYSSSMSNNVLCAAILHDTIEDTNTTYEQLEIAFGEPVADLVLELTHSDKIDASIKKLNRAARHQALLLKLSRMSYKAKIIKLADRIDNLKSVDLDNPECVGFLRSRYIKESKDIHDIILVSDDRDWSMQELLDELKFVIDNLANKLKVKLSSEIYRINKDEV
jgi:guanosine-3',5'-bis(diphosphate) 3'-pyrophosphohydrolase